MADLENKDFVSSIENFDTKDSIADEKETQELTKEKEERKKSRNDFLYILFKREKMPNVPSESIDFGSVFTIQGFKIKGGFFEYKKLLDSLKDQLFIASMQTLVLRPFTEMKNDTEYVSHLEKELKGFLIQKGVIKSSNSVEVFKMSAKEQEKIKENDSIVLLDASKKEEKHLIVDKNLEEFLDKKNKIASIKKGEVLLECVKNECVVPECVSRKINYKDFLHNFAFKGGSSKKNDKQLLPYPIRLDGINSKQAKLLQAVANVVTNTETQANHFKAYSDLVEKGSSVPKALSRTFLGYFHELYNVDQSLNSVDFGNGKMSLSFVEPSSLPMSAETFSNLEKSYQLLNNLSNSDLLAIEKYKKKLLFAMRVDVMKNPENLRLTVDTTKNVISKAEAEKYIENMLSEQVPNVKHGNIPITNKTELKEAEKLLREEIGHLYSDLSPEEREAKIEEALKNHVFERPRNTTETLQDIMGEAEEMRKEMATKRRELAVEKVLKIEKHGFLEAEEKEPEPEKLAVGAKGLF